MTGVLMPERAQEDIHRKQHWLLYDQKVCLSLSPLTVDLDGISNSIRGNKRALGLRATERAKRIYLSPLTSVRRRSMSVCLFALTGMESNYHCRSLCATAASLCVCVSASFD